MEIKVILFGQLSEITGSNAVVVVAETTDQLQERLHADYPLLKNKKYAVAVNHQIINDSIVLKQHDAVALLPPFSGG